MCFLKAHSQTLKQQQFITELKQHIYLTWNKTQRAAETETVPGILWLLCSNHMNTHTLLLMDVHTPALQRQGDTLLFTYRRQPGGSIEVSVCVRVCSSWLSRQDFFPLKTQDTDWLLLLLLPQGHTPTYKHLHICRYTLLCFTWEVIASTHTCTHTNTHTHWPLSHAP